MGAYGWVPDRPDHRDRIYNYDEPLTPKSVTLPVKLSLRPKMPKIFDQGRLGSCTANAIVAALMKAAMNQGEAELMLSRLFLYFNERAMEGTVGEDAGAAIRDGIKSANATGVCPESEWPYDIRKFADTPPHKAYGDAQKHEAVEYKRVLPGTAGSPIRTPILAGDPVVFGFSVPEIFEGNWDPSKEYLPLPTKDEGFIGGHATCITGWDFSLERFKIPVFEVRNSWGPEWGEEGYFWMDCRWFWDRSLALTEDCWVIRRAS